ncbi:MAG: glycosyltransferase [Bacteroidetes bacterium]|nr:glycosyltransferase [Bacteroidota bacterium]
MNNSVGVCLVFNAIQNTSRLFKMTSFLVSSKRVVRLNIIGLWDNSLLTEEDFDKDRKIIRVKNLRQKINSAWIDNHTYIRKILIIIGFFPLYYSVIKKTLECKPNIIYCHDVLWLPVAVLCKWILKCRIIYTPHELETEETGNSKIAKIILRCMEKYCIKRVYYTITVGQSISDWYKKTYKIKNVSVIRNIPECTYTLHSDNILRKLFNIHENDIVFIYQGLLDASRGVLEILDIFKNVSSKKHIVFMGYGGEYLKIKETSNNYINIHYLPAVPPSEIINYTSGADIGIFFIIKSNISLSYKYSLPNKYYEYIKADTPILVSSNLEAMSSEIRSLDIGWSLNSKKENFVTFIDSIKKDEITTKTKNLQKVKHQFDWNKEVQILKSI